MKIILGLLSILFGVNLVGHQVQSIEDIRFIPLVIGLVFLWFGYSILVGKISLKS